MMFLFSLSALRGVSNRTKGKSRLRPRVESLEERLVMATPGVDYVLSGYQWANPSHITYSIAPDGVFWLHGTNNLNAAFNAKFGNGTWQRAIAKDLATWESVANINITEVSDSPLDMNTPGLEQGDPRFGDIRIGGYPFQGNTTTLAQTSYPPPQGGTLAGDIQINTAMNFSIGNSGYDLYSVLLHETGHSLGLAHAQNSAEVMYETYEGVRTGLSAGDIAGIQAIYGARTTDVYQSQGQGLAMSNAIDVSGSLNGSGQATLSNVSLATIGDTEYFTVVAPSGSNEGLSVSAIATNVSMLSPSITLYDSSGHVVATQSNPSAWSNTVTVQASQVQPGQRYYVSVTGATGDVFSVGAYNLQVGFTGVTSPSGPTSPVSPPPPPPPAAPSTPSTPIVTGPTPVTGGTSPIVVIAPDQYEPNNTIAQATRLGAIAAATTLNNLTLNTASDVDDFLFQTTRIGTYQVSAPGTQIRILNKAGRQIAFGYGSVSVSAFRARTPLYISISTPNSAPVANYSLTVTPPVLRARVAPARLRVHVRG